MSIPKPRTKIKTPEVSLPSETFSYTSEGEIEHKSTIKRYFLILFIILVSFLSFGIGKLTRAGNNRNMTITYDPSLQNIDATRATTLPSIKTNTKPKSEQTANAVGSVSPLPTDGQVIASSKGTKYYYTYCKNNISNKNKIVFLTPKEAELAGYSLATNCKVR